MAKNSAVLVVLLAAGGAAADEVPLSWEAGLLAGYRIDAFDWNIADADGSPNVVSELTWDDLRMQTLGIDGRLVVGEVWEVAARLSKGWIYAGDNQDSDYLYDDRQGEYSRSNNKTRKTGAVDAEVSLGYLMEFTDVSAGQKRFIVTPRMGLSYDYLDLGITDGYQTINEFGPTGPIEGLDSRFQATWQGGWVGFGLDLELGDRWWLEGSWRYRFGRYEGEADWNLRDDLKHPKSQSQEADAWGRAWHVLLRWAVAPAWELGLRYDQGDWQAKPGTHYFYMASGTVYRQPLNGAKQESRALSLRLTWRPGS